MPLRSVPFYLVLAIPALYVGCGSTAPRQAHPWRLPTVSADGRPQELVGKGSANSFVGDWGPIARYVANDWVARFTQDGRMSIQGPGLTARGVYFANGKTAEVNYRWRDGAEPSEASLAHATYRLDPNGEMTFSTGLKDDPPVHLRMIR